MSIWDGLFGRRKVKLSITDPTGWNLDQGSSAGKAVNAQTTLQLSTAWSCVRLRSQVMGSLPMDTHERLADGGSRIAKDHWLYSLIHDSPNPDQTAAEFWSGQVACIDLWGDGLSKIERNGLNQPVALYPLRPEQMAVDRDPAGRRRYRYSGPTYAGTYGEADILHLRGFTLGGDRGLSAVSYGRHSMGLAMAADETAAKTFANGLNLSGFVEAAAGTKLTPTQRAELVELFAKFSGSAKAGKVMPLDPGMVFKPLQFNPVDAELLTSRQFNIEDICRWFDTPPVLVGHAGEGQTMWGSGVEQILLGWLTLRLNPFLKGIEQAVMKQLLSPVERIRYFVEYNREALLEADSAAKAAFLSTMAQNGFMSRNDGRRKLNLPKDPSPGADSLTVQSNLVPLDRLGDLPPRAVQPAPGEPAL